MAACCNVPLVPLISLPHKLLSPSSNGFFPARRTTPSTSLHHFARSSSSSSSKRRTSSSGIRVAGGGGLFPVDPWAPSVDSESIAPSLFAASLLPYLVFLYFITKSKTAPKLTLFGFYFLLAFVGATIPAGIYAKVHYGTALSNVDWLHGGAESLLTLTNVFIVLGLRGALRKIKDSKESDAKNVSEIKQKTST